MQRSSQATQSDFLFCFASGLVNTKNVGLLLMSNLNWAVASTPPFCMYCRFVCVRMCARACGTCSGVLSDKPEIYTLK